MDNDGGKRRADHAPVGIVGLHPGVAHAVHAVALPSPHWRWRRQPRPPQDCLADDQPKRLSLAQHVDIEARFGQFGQRRSWLVMNIICWDTIHPTRHQSD